MTRYKRKRQEPVRIRSLPQSRREKCIGILLLPPKRLDSIPETE